MNMSPDAKLDMQSTLQSRLRDVSSRRVITYDHNYLSPLISSSLRGTNLFHFWMPPQYTADKRTQQFFAECMSNYNCVSIKISPQCIQCLLFI